MEDRLFDIADVEPDPRISIAERLGQIAGRFINKPHLIKVEFDPAGADTFYPAQDRSEAYYSPDYAGGSSFEGDFEYWTRLEQKTDRAYQGYLAGFPTLIGPDGQEVRAMHVWTMNSSVFDQTLAFPLTAVKSLVAETKLRNRLRVELEEVELNGISERYQVPMLFDAVGNETMYRPATARDLEKVIADTPGNPLHIYGFGDMLDSMFGRTAVVPTEDELRNLLS